MNFISKLERKLMEQLARDVVASGSVGVIAKVRFRLSCAHRRTHTDTPMIAQRDKQRGWLAG